MSEFQDVALVLALLAVAVRLAGRGHRLLHLLQLEHYEGARLMLWLRRRGELWMPRELGVAALVCAGAVVAHAVGDHAGSTSSAAGWACGALLLVLGGLAALGVVDWCRPAVKPLVFTGRAKRLLGLALVPPALLVLAGIAVAVSGSLTTAALAVLLAVALALLAHAPWTLLAANRALAPVQSAINRRYVSRARAQLRECDPLVVGITGSYGKTTTKFCVGEVLGADRPTLVTPESFNSYLGVVRTVNELLEPRHRAFVVEMGMFRRGDIAELCELVRPRVGAITAIGPMHLERLGSIEAIAAAKSELLQALPHDGCFVTNAHDPRCMELARGAHVPVVLFAICDEQGGDAPAPGRVLIDRRASQDRVPPAVSTAQVLARDVRMQDGRTAFDLQLDGPEGERIAVSAALLGRHNVLNLLAAAAVGRALGIAPERIARGLAQVSAPAHRLQPIHNRRAGVVVIDDAYNSNPEGAAAALEVLGAHPATRRLLVTPGMVELGELESEANRRFGEQAAAVCDIAILVGPARTAPIREGLAAAGMDAAGVHTVRDIGEATALLARLTRAGDVVLFENDLPDTYAETGESALPVV